ncbi:MAG: polysulfide reductase NrfD, partial [Myxococcales bacterium]|nr:polysulfide reductase NrfD [Myxococcales bacterium]
RACMQACPYDALYLNQDTGGAEKCHYCAHRIEQGLEPACVVVCPEEAIVSGDFGDPDSKIAKLRARPDAVVRRPEQGTGPNVHYIGADPVSLDPGAAKEPPTYLWSERRFPAPDYPDGVELWPKATTVLDVNHKVHWGSKVSAYLVTKGIAAGVVALAPMVGTTGLAGYLPELLGLAFLVATLVLLVVDLKRPTKFLSILLRPNTKSWLVKGAWVLGAFGAVVAAALLARLLGLDTLAAVMRVLGVPLALLAAGYTAFLFAQCEGRDLWQNTRWLLPHLLCQAVMLGASVLLPFWPDHAGLASMLLVGAAGHLGIALRDAYGSHHTRNAKLAASLMPRIEAWPRAGYLAFRAGLWLTTLAATGAALLVAMDRLDAFSGAVLLVLGVVGTFFYEQAYVRAGQLPPLS